MRVGDILTCEAHCILPSAILLTLYILHIQQRSISPLPFILDLNATLLGIVPS